MDINLNFIRCFEILADTLSFSVTSEKLRLAQSNVSRQIKVLENSLGVRLFHRTRHEVSLTPEGQRFREEVLPLMLDLRERLDAFTNQQREESGEIRLGCFSEVGRNFFMPLCLEFQKEFPRINLEMIYQSENSILQMLTRSEIEFGIVSHPPIIEGLAAFPLLKQKIGLFGPRRETPPSREELEGAPFIAFEKTDALLTELWSKQISKRRKPYLVTVVNSHGSMIDAIGSTRGYAVLPLLSAKSAVADGKIQQVEGFEFETPLFLVHPQSSFVPRKNQAFKQFILQRCKEVRETWNDA